MKISSKPDFMTFLPESKAVKPQTKVVIPELQIVKNEVLKQEAIKIQQTIQITKMTKEEQKNFDLNFFDSIFAPAEKN